MQKRVRAAFISDLLRLLCLHLLGENQDSELTSLISHRADDRVACLGILGSPTFQGLPQSFPVTDSLWGSWGDPQGRWQGLWEEAAAGASIADPCSSSVQAWLT